jgi:hypothetical protein
MNAWLIARTDLERTYWFTVYLGELTFSSDVNDAVRFCREQDASDMIDNEFFTDFQVETMGYRFLCAQ